MSFIKSITLFILVFAVLSAQASIITTGNLLDDGRGGSTVDHWRFTVNTAGVVSIDILSWEEDYGGLGVVDINGDGEIAFFDPYIYLFSDDGSLDTADLITANDDSSSTYGDGSVSGLDSFLSTSLGTGGYILAIGAYYLSEDDAIDRINDGNSFYPTSCVGGIASVGDDYCTYVENDHGDYQITWTGDLTITSDPGTSTVPEPAILTLLGLGLLGLGFSRRKRV